MIGLKVLNITEFAVSHVFLIGGLILVTIGASPGP